MRIYRALISLLFIAAAMAQIRQFAGAANQSAVLVASGSVDRDLNLKGQWLGLMKSKGKYYCKFGSLRLKPVSQPIPADAPYRSIEFGKSGEELIMAIRGMPGLKAGPMRTFFYGNRAFEPGANLAITAGGKAFHLKSSGKAIPSENPEVTKKVFENFKLVFGAGVEQQTILSRSQINDYDGIPTLIWSGDLNIDGIPDLLIQDNEAYMQVKYKLFLSDRKTGKLKLTLEDLLCGC